MKTIGITGGIASGKSYVTSQLIKEGYTVIDCDEISHNLLKEEIVKKRLLKEFGNGIFENTNISRIKLGNRVFNNPEELQILNSIIHPLVIEEVKEKIREFNGEILFVDAPLLYEIGLDEIMDAVIVVYVNYKTQVDRLMNRDGIDLSTAKHKISLQMPLIEKTKKADYIIDNSSSFAETNVEIKNILRRIKNEV